MNPPRQSSGEVAYDIRPRKQIERRMILDGLQRLTRVGFDIPAYNYIGFGAYFFYDFLMLHRYLGMNRLLSLEHDESLRKRVLFNKPFSLIRVEFKPASDVLPTLDLKRKYLVWLDYDDRLKESIAEDVRAAANRLTKGSILLVTVDVEPRKEWDGPNAYYDYYAREVESYFNDGWTARSFARSNLVNVNKQILFNILDRGLSSRKAVNALPLFSFDYADGHRMYTLGTMIGSDVERDTLKKCDFADAKYIRTKRQEKAYEIDPPNLTRKERYCLDSYMPGIKRPNEFELDPELLERYREIYRYFPTYGELFA